MTSFNLETYSHISTLGLKMLADSLRQSSSSTLLSLNLDRCQGVKSEGWASFCDMLCHLIMLQELSLSDVSIPLESVGGYTQNF